MTLELAFWSLVAKNGIFASANSVLKTVNTCLCTKTVLM